MGFRASTGVSEMTLQEIIADIHGMDRELQEYEDKYGLRSRYFYELYTSGKLRDEDPDESREWLYDAAGAKDQCRSVIARLPWFARVTAPTPRSPTSRQREVCGRIQVLAASRARADHL